MAAPFAALIARINADVETHLANAEADFGGAVGVVPGIFRNEYAESFGTVAGSRPVFECRASRVAAVQRDAAVTIDAVAYTVAEIKPGDSGMTVMCLEAV